MIILRKYNITCIIYVLMRNYYLILIKIKKRGNNNSINYLVNIIYEVLLVFIVILM